MRLDKFISNLTNDSRTIIKKEIKKGVLVNDILVYDNSIHINENNDIIIYKGKTLKYNKFVYYMLNKPSGFISDTTSSNSVLTLIKSDDKVKNLSMIGRLDKDTEGLLILTNDGDLIHKVTSPKKNIPKKYFIKTNILLNDDFKNVFSKEIILENTTFKPSIFEKIDDYSCYLTINEGQFHQIKRMIHYIGGEVLYLKRVQIGNLELDKSLKIGEYKALSFSDINKLTYTMDI